MFLREEWQPYDPSEMELRSQMLFQLYEIDETLLSSGEV